MVPYRGRLALRIARVSLAFACLGGYIWVAGRFTHILAVLAVYLVYALGNVFWLRLDSPGRASVGLALDIVFFAFWIRVASDILPGWTGGAWMSALLCGYVLASAALLHALSRVVLAAVVTVLLAALLTPRGDLALTRVAIATGAVALAVGAYRRYLEGRMSHTLRHNVLVRSQAQGAREAERQRIAADFHDGPLQSFIGFQIRLEIIKKLLARDVEAASEELRQLQELCRGQVGELRGFVRSMRPPEEGVSLAASLSRMLEQFQRDTGVAATFTSGHFDDPAETEVSLELLRIVRETLHNIQKHSGASRVAVSLAIRDGHLEILAEDNGSGFPFSGSFTLDELELLRMGPVSIKRRVRMLGGELQVDSRPGQGARLQVRIPL